MHNSTAVVVVSGFSTAFPKFAATLPPPPRARVLMVPRVFVEYPRGVEPSYLCGPWLTTCCFRPVFLVPRREKTELATRLKLDEPGTDPPNKFPWAMFTPDGQRRISSLEDAVKSSLVFIFKGEPGGMEWKSNGTEHNQMEWTTIKWTEIYPAGKVRMEPNRTEWNGMEHN